MFGFHTPKQTMGTSADRDQGPSTQTTGHGTSPQAQRATEARRAPIPSVRKSIGEWESGKPTEAPRQMTTSPKKAEPVEAPKQKQRTLPSQESRSTARRVSTEATASPPTQSKVKYTDRMAEAKACVTKAKLHLGNSRNIKTEIKTEVTQAIERLYQLVKESETAKGTGSKKVGEQPKEKAQEEDKRTEKELSMEGKELMKRMEEHAQLIKENSDRMEKLKETIEKDIVERKTYASAAAAPPRWQMPERTALHSVVVSSTDDMETGEEVLEKVRKAVDAKEGWVKVERVRKAKDKKIIMSCSTQEERRRIKERLETAGVNLVVEEVKNKDPLLILKDVLLIHSDEEVLRALKNQNREIFHGLDNETGRIEVKYRKKARNPLVGHIILSVSPQIWKRATEAGKLRVDLQNVHVEDQSPLVQCSKCLGYGHGRRFCREPAELCSHCGGHHLSIRCTEKPLGVGPECVNCKRSQMENCAHNAFSRECPVRKRWDTIARASVAYC